MLIEYILFARTHTSSLCLASPLFCASWTQSSKSNVLFFPFDLLPRCLETVTGSWPLPSPCVLSVTSSNFLKSTAEAISGLLVLVLKQHYTVINTPWNLNIHIFTCITTLSSTLMLSFEYRMFIFDYPPIESMQFLSLCSRSFEVLYIQFDCVLRTTGTWSIWILSWLSWMLVIPKNDLHKRKHHFFLISWLED